jgi:mutual gliding-motility protein MglA
MVQLNHAARELIVKIVYYGPGLSGKTTNLQAVFERINPEIRGRMLTVDTADDRTLFLDLLPLFFQARSGLKVKVKLFTVPGQTIHNATRRIVLQGADAIAFIADSQRSMTAENNAYWKNMLENLKENGISDIPIVIQFNKKDLPDTRSDEEIEEMKRRGKEPVFSAVAVRGEGVVETLHGVIREAYRSLDQKFRLAEKFGLTEIEFLSHVFGHVDTKGTALEGRYS